MISDVEAGGIVRQWFRDVPKGTNVTHAIGKLPWGKKNSVAAFDGTVKAFGASVLHTNRFKTGSKWGADFVTLIPAALRPGDMPSAPPIAQPGPSGYIRTDDEDVLEAGLAAQHYRITYYGATRELAVDARSCGILFSRHSLIRTVQRFPVRTLRDFAAFARPLVLPVACAMDELFTRERDVRVNRTLLSIPGGAAVVALVPMATSAIVGSRAHVVGALALTFVTVLTDGDLNPSQVQYILPQRAGPGVSPETISGLFMGPGPTFNI